MLLPAFALKDVVTESGMHKNVMMATMYLAMVAVSTASLSLDGAAEVDLLLPLIFVLSTTLQQ